MRFGGGKKKVLTERGNTPNKRQPPVYSYYSSRTPQAQHDVGRSHSHSSRSTPRFQLPPLKYLPLIVSVTLIVISIAYTTTLSSNPRISITNSPELSILRDQSVYARHAEKILESSIMNANKITINTDAVAINMKKQFPELREVVVSLPLIGRRPKVDIIAASPALVIRSINSSDTYVVDTEGRAVVPVSDVARDIVDKIPVVNDRAGGSIKPGSQILPTDFVLFISHINKALTDKSFAVSTIDLPVTINEVHVQLEGQDYYTKYNTSLDVLQQVGAYLALSERLDEQGIAINEYIDVRVSERAYYK